MKTARQVRRDAKRLWRLCLVDGWLDDSRVRQVVDRVIESWRADGDDVIAAAYGGVRLHPVLLARAAWPLVPDEGARVLEGRLVSCDDLTAPGDVDFAGD